MSEIIQYTPDPWKQHRQLAIAVELAGRHDG